MHGCITSPRQRQQSLDLCDNAPVIRDTIADALLDYHSASSRLRLAVAERFPVESRVKLTRLEGGDRYGSVNQQCNDPEYVFVFWDGIETVRKVHVSQVEVCES